MRALVLTASLAGVLLAQGEMVELEGWRAMDGDDPRWASAEFDDSAWPRSAPPLSEVTVEQGTGVTWYRTAFRIPGWWADRDLAVGLWKLDDGYEVFVNGVKIGQHGTPERVYSFRPLAFVIPRTLVPGGLAQVAVRRWRLRGDTRFEGFDISYLRRFPPVIGLKQTVLQEQRILWLEVFSRGLPGLIATLLTLACALFCLSLWRRGEGPELLWAGLATALAALAMAQAWPMFLTDAYPKNSLAAVGVTVASVLGAHLCYAWFLAEAFPAWRRPLRWAGVALALGLSGLLLGFLGFRSMQGWFSAVRAVAAALATGLGLLVAWRVRSAGDALLVGPVLAVTLRSGVYLMSALNNNLNFWTIGPFLVSFRRTADAVIALALAALLYRRAQRQQAARRALEEDVAAAGRMQALLMEAGVAATPGFTVETAYVPSREVGGDFYQILPGGDGSLLVVAGDVSGKGLEAAILVSVAVGILATVRTEAPGAVLAALNDGIAGRAKGRFITCVCARFLPDGRAVIANAGHPAPYGDGSEVPLEPGLPLGVAAGLAYEESVARGERFTFVSDGVVEAANARGELLGFDATRELSGKSASEIAEAARAWGQNDDITVVTVRRTPA